MSESDAGPPRQLTVGELFSAPRAPVRMEDLPPTLSPTERRVAGQLFQAWDRVDRALEAARQALATFICAAAEHDQKTRPIFGHPKIYDEVPARAFQLLEEALAALRDRAPPKPTEGEPMMSHVFEGAPDARQSADPAMPTSRFRPRYRALSEPEKILHDQIKDAATEMERLLLENTAGRRLSDYVALVRRARIKLLDHYSQISTARGEGIDESQIERELTLARQRLKKAVDCTELANLPAAMEEAMVLLEESVMWAVKALTASKGDA